MKKVLYKSCDGKRVYMTGIKEDILWKSTAYHRGPQEFGEYTVSNGDGNTFTLFYTGSHLFAEELFRQIMHDYYREGVVLHDTGASLSNDDLLELYKTCGVWYNIVDGKTDSEGWCEQMLVIYKDDDKPKYFLDKNPSGPIEADVETYEEEIETNPN